jgi:hypothetical protein
MNKFTEVFLTESKKPSRVFKAPVKTILPKDGVSIFLAGSIEMGKAEDWQTKVTKLLTSHYENIYIFNPRRDDWSSDWKQEIENKQFNEQVTWELSHIESSTIMLVHFDPKTQSPITLAELGIACGKFPDKVIVSCPEGFFRKGNVDIICHRYGVTQIESLDDELIEAVAKKSNKLKEK